jgi:TetR/AcrR family transcriptional regulator, tetracycline repressor protein
MPSATADVATRDRLLAVTRHVVEAAPGPDSGAPSVRHIAAAAGVAPTALYWHFGSRRGLLDAVLDALVTDLPPLEVRGGTPRRRVLSLARSMRAQVKAGEPAHRLARELGRVAELSVPAQVALAREISAAGLTGAAAARAVRAVLYVVGGFILVEDHHRQRPPGDQTSQELWRTVDDPAVAPPLRAAMRGPQDDDALFTYTLEHLVDAIVP